MAFKLKKIGENTYYIENPTNFGVYRCEDNGVYVFDTGLDDDSGRKILRAVEEKGWHIKAIINTHSNADHIGGNHYLQKKTGCKVFAYGVETMFTKYPYIEPAFLYGGYPCKDIQHKFFVAKGSEVLDFTSPEYPSEIAYFPLPGHYFDMVGLRTPDNVVFAADCLSSERTLNKYGITFIYDVAAYIATLNELQQMQAEWFVPAHAKATNDIAPLARINLERVDEIEKQLLLACQTPHTFDEILKIMFDHYGLSLDFSQYILVGSTVRSFLAWMKDKGDLTVDFSDNVMRWSKV